MWREAEAGICRRDADDGLAAGDEFAVAVEIVGKAQLAALQRPAVDAALGIVDGKERQADAGRVAAAAMRAASSPRSA